MGLRRQFLMLLRIAGTPPPPSTFVLPEIGARIDSLLFEVIECCLRLHRCTIWVVGIHFHTYIHTYTHIICRCVSMYGMPACLPVLTHINIIHTYTHIICRCMSMYGMPACLCSHISISYIHTHILFVDVCPCMACLPACLCSHISISYIHTHILFVDVCPCMACLPACLPVLTRINTCPYASERITPLRWPNSVLISSTWIPHTGPYASEHIIAPLCLPPC